jgi:hypothetical protein
MSVGEEQSRPRRAVLPHDHAIRPAADAVQHTEGDDHAAVV